MLVAALAVQADARQLHAHVAAGLAVLLWQAQAQAAIRHSEFEVLDQLRMVQPARGQVLPRVGRGQ